MSKLALSFYLALTNRMFLVFSYLPGIISRAIQHLGQYSQLCGEIPVESEGTRLNVSPSRQ